jgi:peptide/nickel transport system permease protein
MFQFCIRRLLHAIPILLGVSLVVFLLVHLAPGDAIDMLVPPEAAPDDIARVKAEFGLDQPLYLQYLIWLRHVAVGDFGISIFSGQPVIDEVLTAFSRTMLIALPAALIGFSLGITFGLLAAAHGRTWLDRLFSAVAITGVSLPHYWFAIVLVIVFSVLLNILPSAGMGSEGFPRSFEDLRYLVLPIVTLSLMPMGVVARMARATALDVLSRDFIGGLQARGLGSHRLRLHVIRNAAPAVLAVMGLQLGYLLGGSILVETVFNWPGAGNLLSLAIFRRDVPVLQGVIILLAFFFVILNLLVDVAQAAIDPRIRR